MAEENQTKPSGGPLRTRLPELIAEGLLIVFAVLIALAVDEFWEGLEEKELVRSAQENIVSELRNNREELEGARANNHRLLDDVANAITAANAGEPIGISNVNYEVSLLGADAWEAARITRAVHFMDFDRVSRISETYGVQNLFLERQTQIVDGIANIRLGPTQTIQDAFQPILSGLRISLDMECGLIESYNRVIVELGGDSAAGNEEPPTLCN